MESPIMAESAREVLAFRLGNEEYGISTLKVQEIRGYDSVTRIANAPAFLKGVINLRGVIVPIVDLRVRFGAGTPVFDQFTVVIVLNIGAQVIGAVVDSVSDVTTLTSGQVKPAPQMGAASGAACLEGIAALDGRMLLLLDIDKLMSSDEMGLVQAAATAE